MRTTLVPSSASLPEPSIIITSAPAPAPTGDHDAHRGRKRDRSSTRSNVRAIRCAPSDECSTLRGRSRHRATSPWGQPSRASSPSILSQTRKRMLHVHAHLRRAHCPSRGATPPQEQQRTFRRRQRTRSRSRGPMWDVEREAMRAGDALSGLRNEVLVEQDHLEEPNERS